jgi:hypothetical protein
VKHILLSSILTFATMAGCHAQVPASSSPTVALTVTASTSCTSTAPACTYIYSRATVATATTACPATTGTAYVPINQTAPAPGLVFTDSTPPSGYVCYVAQTVQSGMTSVASQPSNGGLPLTIAAPPTAPGPPSASPVAQAEPTVTDDQPAAFREPRSLTATVK